MLTAATQVAVLYVMVAAGYISDKTGVFSEKTARSCVDLLHLVIGPCVMINSFIAIERTDENIKKFFISLSIALLTHIIAIIINLPFFRKKDDKDCVYKFSCIFGNVGFMALPLASAVLGEEGVFYCTNGIIAYNIFLFTFGVKIMSKEKGGKFDWKKLILNPGVISVLIGLPIFLLDLEIPYILTEPISKIGSLNSPLAMLVFGTYLSKTDLKTIFFDKKIYLVSVIKLLVVPVVCFAIYALIGLRESLLVACIITASVPCANSTFMFSSKYGRDTAVASKTVALVSFISILTMPVMIALAQSI